MRRDTGYIHEVFGSFQGEGPHAGERHIFVRFCGCNLSCAYCDTPASKDRSAVAYIEGGPGLEVSAYNNPMAWETVLEAVLNQERQAGFNQAVCVTGGEPLVQAGFLRAVLEGLGGRMPVMLETNGILCEELPEVLGLVDIISMDVKLPSVSRQGPLWQVHEKFMKLCAGKELIIKAVVSEDTSAAEVEKASGLAADNAPEAVFVLQPMTNCDGKVEISDKKMLSLYAAARGRTKNVRVIPQLHKILGVK